MTFPHHQCPICDRTIETGQVECANCTSVASEFIRCLDQVQAALDAGEKFVEQHKTHLRIMLGDEARNELAAKFETNARGFALLAQSFKVDR